MTTVEDSEKTQVLNQELPAFLEKMPLRKNSKSFHFHIHIHVNHQGGKRYRESAGFAMSTVIGLSSSGKRVGNALSRHIQQRSGFPVMSNPFAWGVEIKTRGTAGQKVDLFASQSSTHCRMVEEDALADAWPSFHGFPLVPLIMPPIHRVLQGEPQTAVDPNWPGRVWFPLLYPLNGIPWCLPERLDLLSKMEGSIWHPNPSRLLVLYANRLEAGLAAIKVHLAAILASHMKLDGKTIGSHGMRGVQPLRPPRLRTIPSWDLTLVLGILSQPPFEPICSLKWLKLPSF
ncbi:hypothetical protein N1851_006396 [Merluccius polli]|uniref:Uncharacterized protein n=1 Tax=Merluccius polli TaxID=89951 RepID=A0AA47N5G2_MERPO|nr:hypothetical protein N1851_006396 [Merluccius polli]